MIHGIKYHPQYFAKEKERILKWVGTYNYVENLQVKVYNVVAFIQCFRNNFWCLQSSHMKLCCYSSTQPLSIVKMAACMFYFYKILTKLILASPGIEISISHCNLAGK